MNALLPSATHSGYSTSLQAYVDAINKSQLVDRVGQVRQVKGMAIYSQGPDVTIGELCRIRPSFRAGTGGRSKADASKLKLRQVDLDDGILAEVTGFSAGLVTLVPYGSSDGIREGAEVVAVGRATGVGVGPDLVGRVIDGFGEPLDGGSRPATDAVQPLLGARLNPMKRPPVTEVMETGIRAIDGLLTLGQGQRIGIFAGSGVGKSTLLGMIAQHVKADINVIALIGERGREVREFIEKQLGPEGLRRSVVVVATADQPALSRIRAAHAAVAIAEYFRDQGKQILLTMDSVTRLAMARREVSLASGEPPTARGYTPSVFAELPQLCERCGTSDSGGSITALMTVLVEGDDFNEPISDHLRAILDGHIVLSRSLAHGGQYPAIDVLQSASRLRGNLTSVEHQTLVDTAVKHLSLIERNRQMVEIGAYEAGSSPLLDDALKRDGALKTWLTQRKGGADRREALQQLKACMQSQVAAISVAGKSL